MTDETKPKKRRGNPELAAALDALMKPDHDDTTGSAGERREEERAGELRALSVRVAKATGWQTIHFGRRTYWVRPGAMEASGRVRSVRDLYDELPPFAEDDREAVAVLRAGVERFGGYDVSTSNYDMQHGIIRHLCFFGGLFAPLGSGETFAEAVCRAFVAAAEAEGGRNQEGAGASDADQA